MKRKHFNLKIRKESIKSIQFKREETKNADAYISMLRASGLVVQEEEGLITVDLTLDNIPILNSADFVYAISVSKCKSFKIEIEP